MKLRDYAFSDDGNVIVGATVETTVNGAGTPTDATTTDSDGKWEFLALSNAHYNTEITDGASVRHLKGDICAQFETIVGLDGNTAPLANSSITAAMLQSTVVPNHNITISSSDTMSGSTGALKTILGALAGLIKAITGKDNWWEVPDISLSDLDDYFDPSTGHTHDGTDSPYISLTRSGEGLGSTTNFTASSWVNGPDLELEAGTYLLLANVTLVSTGGSFSSDCEVRLWDGSTTYVHGATTVPSGGYGHISLQKYVTLASTTTVKVSAREKSGRDGSIMYMEPDSTVDSQAKGVEIMAIRIA